MPNQPSDLKSFVESIRDQPFLVLDTETTGLGVADEICEMAIIDSLGAVLFNELIRPTKPISADATRITGISDRMVADKATWLHHYEHVHAILAGKIVVTYNATFDRKMIHQTDRAHALPEIDWQGHASWYCAMTAFAERYGNWNDYRASFQWVKLIEAVEFYGIAPDGAFHGALADAKMTLQVINNLIADVDCINAAEEYDPAVEFWTQVPGFPSPMHREHR